LTESISVGGATSYCTVCLPERENEDHAGEECVVSGYSHPTSGGATTTTGSGSQSSNGAGKQLSNNLILITINLIKILPAESPVATPGILHTAEQYVDGACGGSDLAAAAAASNNSVNSPPFVLRSDVEDSGLMCAYGKVGNEACFVSQTLIAINLLW
jgi:hypothetical protein